MNFLALSGKIIFVFPKKNMMLFFRRKMKDFSPKKYMEI